ncbi:class I SAM-dependent methyltransferase [Streptomyces sp. NPDC127190]|uniref:class I SAM-dependent methyltransferase n=1 Tax=unclassified Streptomyces TaxID=2593676 RepID=UPI0036454B7F
MGTVHPWVCTRRAMTGLYDDPMRQPAADPYWNTNVARHPGILRAVPEGCGDALDVGCGDGLLARKLAGRAKRVTGIDTSPDMIACARESAAGNPQLAFVEGDFLTVELPGVEYDFVCSVTTIHHMDFEAALVRMRGLNFAALVDHLPVAVALGPPAPAGQPTGNGQQFPYQGPLVIAHVRVVPGRALRPVGRVPEPVGETVTPRSGPTGPGNHDHATLRQQGLLLLAGLDIRELPRGPSSMRPHRQTHPGQAPVRTRPTTRAEREQPVRTPNGKPPCRLPFPGGSARPRMPAVVRLLAHPLPRRPTGR